MGLATLTQTRPDLVTKLFDGGRALGHRFKALRNKGTKLQSNRRIGARAGSASAKTEPPNLVSYMGRDQHSRSRPAGDSEPTVVEESQPDDSEEQDAEKVPGCGKGARNRLVPFLLLIPFLLRATRPDFISLNRMAVESGAIAAAS